MLGRCFLFLAFTFWLGCSTRGTLEVANLDRPLTDLQSIAARSMPLGLRRTSANGREYFSNYFLAADRRFKPADKGPERSYAHILVLGDRRPYDLEILVHRERLEGSAYVEFGLDQRIAKVIRSRVVQELTKRREDLNIIDDFRVF